MVIMNRLEVGNEIILNDGINLLEVNSETHQNFEVNGNSKLVIIGNNCNIFIRITTNRKRFFLKLLSIFL